MFQRYFFFFILFFTSLILSGCTKNFQSTLDSVKAARELSRAPLITTAYIDSLPFASSLVSINDGHQLLLILGNVNINPKNHSYRLTWFANDKGSITTENGRIVHTTGFDKNNLENMLSSNILPSPQASIEWEAIYDWSPGYRYNFNAKVHSRLLGTETLTTERWTQSTNHIQETVKFTGLNSEFSNHYWVAPDTNNTKAFVVKSIQYLGPQMDKVEMLMIKPFIEPKPEATSKHSSKDAL